MPPLSHHLPTMNLDLFSLISLFFGFTERELAPKYVKLTYIVRIVTVVLQICCFTEPLYNILFESMKMYHLSRLIKTGFVVLSFAITCYKQREMKEVFNTLWASLDATKKEELKRFTNMMAFYWIAVVIFDEIAQNFNVVYHHIVVKSYENYPFSLHNLALRFTFTSVYVLYGCGWIILSSAFFLRLNYILLLLAHQNYYEVNEKFDQLSMQQISTKFIEFHKWRVRVNEILGYIPTFWFVEIFFATCLRISQFVAFNDYDARVNFFIIFWVEYTLLGVTNMMIILLISNYNKKVKEFCTIVWHRVCLWPGLTPSKSHRADIKLMFLLWEQLMLKLSISDLMVIDRKLILGFSAAAITFSVMLVQLLERPQ